MIWSAISPAFTFQPEAASNQPPPEWEGVFSEGVTMSVRHQQTVERYTRGRAEALAMLENLREFIEGMPVADAHGAIPGVGYDYVNRFEAIREKLSDCELLMDAMSEG
jgi:hypothetical protein